MMSGRREMWNEEEMNGKQWTTEELWKTTLHKLRAILFFARLDGNNNWKSTLLRILVRKVSLRVLVVGGGCRRDPYRSNPHSCVQQNRKKYNRRRACGRGRHFLFIILFPLSLVRLSSEVKCRLIHTYQRRREEWYQHPLIEYRMPSHSIEPCDWVGADSKSVCTCVMEQTEAHRVLLSLN